LRTQWGVDLREVSVRFGKDYLKHLYQTINKYVDSNHLVVNNQVLQLTHSGKFISDQIIADLFVA
jgi:oxygen-independent coproporphyrinogen-3 oxidase